MKLVELKFVSDIVGHNEQTIMQMYYDWLGSPFNYRNNNSSQLETQVNKDFCEWLEIKDAYGIIYETDCEHGFICGDYEKLEKDFKYCPYCGKPIKIKKK